MRHRPVLLHCKLSSVLALLVCSCAVGPDYTKPDVSDVTPAQWRWKPAEPEDTVAKGPWWEIHEDPVLDGLEQTAVAHNQDLRAAVARVDEARSVARISRSHFYPTISLDPYYSRQRSSGNLPTPIPIDIPAAYIDTFSVPVDLSYEVDLWGRVHRSFDAAHAQAQASVADYQNVLLMLTADVATDYFLIRSLDAELATFRRTIELRTDYLRVVTARFDAGIGPEIDVEQAKIELASAKADFADTTRTREETFNALALLCGAPPNSFQLEDSPKYPEPIVVPAGLPSSLLERRPDIAAAERNLAASCEHIGIAKAAYFPALRLTGQAGFLSNEAQSVFSADSFVWSITPSLTLPLFTGGRTDAEVEQARAEYEESLARYRQTVLRAFKEVEDSLADIVLRNRQAEAQAEALVSSRRVMDLAQARYEAGNTSYLEFVDAERTQLYQERLRIQIEYRQLSASINLIKALGGTWVGHAPTE